MTTQNENDIMRAIDEATRDVAVPESLRPEAVERLLEREQARENAQVAAAAASKRRAPSGWRKRALPWGIAACLVLVAGVGLVAGRAILDAQGGPSGGDDPGLFPLGSGALEPAVDPDAPVDAGIASAESYDQVKQCFDDYKAEQERLYGADGGVMLLESAPSAGAEERAATSAQDTASPSNAAPAAAAGGGHSDTNVRTEGVDEADIVKTDGEHLFILQDNATEIAVVDATDDAMRKVGSIFSGNQGQISEFYVRDGKALVLSNVSLTSTDKDGYEVYNGSEVQLETFDVSDVQNPKLLGTVTQSGWYQSSRLADGHLYLFSTYVVPYSEEGDDIEPYIPRVAGQMVACQDIYLPPLAGASQYLVIASVSVDDPTQTVDQKAVLTDSNSLYVSAENIYVYENKWRMSVARDGDGGADQGRITVRKISYHDGQLEGVAQTKVSGTLNDSFSIDEHEGMLRLVTTVSSWDADAKQQTSTNEVHVLDGNLEEVGSITGLAEDERVYSARFFGDTAYFVTFRETDPLFTVDLSDPTNPQIIGSLKIPGFSEYLHPYGEGKLLGIGMDVDEKSGVTNGMKVTMFDVSDPTDVKEADTFLIEGAYGSDVFHEYRAVLVSVERNLIGFSGYADRETYYVFDYADEAGFAQLMAEEVNGSGWTGTRGVYIDDTLYVVKGNAVESYRIGTYEKVDDLLL
ncbi:beta-propeller domain-containing protein [Arabiibacter massiliensis]|uniref:beta-propeller domain-containing protein n=1 Tax=Arabiibacter massiliensis TaxID=1870985 RepID=UPI0009B9F64A|nr:beta-propeller domain-containing protein [Arabiibacter massiliensis]